MEYKKIIPCLDIKDGRVVKGINFEELKDVEDPVKVAKLYDKEGADEIVLLDITATYEKRKTMIDLVKKVAKEVSAPITIGGGISTIDDMERLIDAGASNVSINTAAVKNMNLISEASKRFGKDSIVIAIDTKKNGSSYDVYINGGRENTKIDVYKWCKQAESLGAGGLLVTSIDFDGTKDGYDLELYKNITSAVKIPVIASGGAGSIEDFKNVFAYSNVAAALGASVFHYGEIKIRDLKEYLIKNNILCRM